MYPVALLMFHVYEPSLLCEGGRCRAGTWRNADGDAESAAGVGEQGDHCADVVAIVFVCQFGFGFGSVVALASSGGADDGLAGPWRWWS